jgi:hypothetical protein
VTLTEVKARQSDIEFLDDEKHPDAKIGIAETELFACIDLIKADKQPRFVKPIGEWNKGRVVVTPDNKVTRYLSRVEDS